MMLAKKIFSGAVAGLFIFSLGGVSCALDFPGEHIRGRPIDRIDLPNGWRARIQPKLKARYPDVTERRKSPENTHSQKKPGIDITKIRDSVSTFGG